jgi:short-subunit dehydrogenase
MGDSLETMKRAIIVGATSGIGYELAKTFSSHGYEVGIAGRRTDLLEKLSMELPNRAYTATIDVRNTESAILALEKLIADMGDVDIIVVSAGTGHVNPSLDWPRERDTIDTNVSGFVAMAGVAMRYFAQKGSGHLVGISSVACVRGDNMAPAYGASKAFISNYLEGLSKKAAKERLAITVTDIRPGFIDTGMMRKYVEDLNREAEEEKRAITAKATRPGIVHTAMANGVGLFWVASPQKAASQIYEAIQRKRKRAYVTRRWAMAAWLLRLMPDWIYNKI